MNKKFQKRFSGHVECTLGITADEISSVVDSCSLKVQKGGRVAVLQNNLLDLRNSVLGIPQKFFPRNCRSSFSSNSRKVLEEYELFKNILISEKAHLDA